jgi:sarcinarray family protein
MVIFYGSDILKRWLYFITIVFFVLWLNQIALAEPEENDFGIVNAWYNGQEATVKDVQLKIDEPFEIKVEVTSKKNSYIAIYLDSPLTTKAYQTISGPSEMDEWIHVTNVESGWNETYSWIIVPTGDWTNGNAPINIFIQFTTPDNDKQSVEFTIVNPTILDEQYSGSNPSHTTTTSSSTNQSQSNSSPSFGIIGALLSVALVVRWKQRNI